MHSSYIATWKLYLTPLSSCLLTNQPPSSAKSAFFLACKSVSILPHASFSFTPLLFLTYTIFCLLFLLSFFLCHPYAIARVIFPQRELSLLSWHLFNSSIAYYRNSVFTSNPNRISYSLCSPVPHIPLVITTPTSTFHNCIRCNSALWPGSAEMLAVYQGSVPYQCLSSARAGWCHCMF